MQVIELGSNAHFINNQRRALWPVWDTAGSRTPGTSLKYRDRADSVGCTANQRKVAVKT